MDPVSGICNVLTITDASIKVAKTISKPKYWLNRLKPRFKVAVFGESGAGKSCFLGMLLGKAYDGGTTRHNEQVDYTLPNGRRLRFYDCPGQRSLKDQRQQIRKQIINGRFQAIINVVCFGYQENETTRVKIFDKSTNSVSDKYLADNRKRELEQLKEWAGDINHECKLKWILTLCNKADVWHEIKDEVLDYYTEKSEYTDCLLGIERHCHVHVLEYCSMLSPFGGEPMVMHISEKDKIKMHLALIENLTRYIEDY